MNRRHLRARTLLSLIFALALPTIATAAPTSAPHAHASLPPHAYPIHYPKTKLHTKFVVEVNAKGQVVRVRSGRSCPDLTYNAQTYGNVLQMWIRRPNGSAVVGVYRVTYDYDPVSHQIRRGIALLWKGGNWGNKEGAANEMIDIARREAHATPRPSLPPLDLSTPTPHPHS